MQTTRRYEYASYRTSDRAAEALEDMFAAGEICEGEHPTIERRGGKTASWSKPRYRWAIVVDG